MPAVRRRPPIRPVVEALEGREMPAVAVGPPFRVNTATAGNHAFSDVAGSRNGTSVVVWDAESQPGATTGQIQAQRFGPQKQKVGSPIAVSMPGRNIGSPPKVAIDDRGNFIVVWKANGAIVAQRYTAGGARLGRSFTVATGAFNGSALHAPDVAMDRAGNFVVTYLEYRRQAPGDVVVARLYGADGRFRRGVVAAPGLPGTYEAQSVACSPDGRFAVGAFLFEPDQRAPQHSSHTALLFRFSAAGDRLSAHRFVAPGMGFPEEDAVQVAMDDRGHTVFAFQIGFEDIQAVTVSAGGRVLPAVQVNAEYAILQAIAVERTTGRFVVAYKEFEGPDYVASLDVYGRNYGRVAVDGKEKSLATVGPATAHAFFVTYSTADLTIVTNPTGNQIFGRFGTY